VVVTDDFIYIHIPKTGGTFVEAVLRAAMQRRGAPYLDTSTAVGRAELGAGKHGGVADVPAKHREKPIVATVRNPYDHLVSHYEFGWWRTHPGDVFDEESIRSEHPDYPQISFQEYVEALYDSRMLDKTSTSVLERVLHKADIGRRTIEYIRRLARQPENVESLGPLDAARALAIATDGVHFLRCENLNRDLYEFLVSLGHPPDRAQFVLEMERIYPYRPTRDPSRRWQEYYGPTVKELVRRKERALFAIFPEYDV
jgi:hypothetical protein